MTKKILCVIVLMLAFVCAFVSCGDNSDNNNNITSSSTDNTTNNTQNSGNSSHTHAFEGWETVKAATCTAEGTKERYCSCGEKQTATIMATGHSFGEWKTVKEPTETEKGLQERACACGEKETKDLDMLPAVVGVTKEEWLSAFYLIGVKSYTINFIDQMFDGTNLVNDKTGKFMYDNGFYRESEIDPGYSDTFEFVDYNYETFSTIFDIDCDSQVIAGIEILFEMDNLGYDLFTFDKATKSYTGNITLGEVTGSMTVKFNDSNLIESIKVNAENDGYSMVTVCEFSNYNSTTIDLPINEMESTVNSILGFLDAGKPVEIYSDYHEFDDVDMDELRKDLAKIIRSISYENMEEFSRSPGESFTIALQSNVEIDTISLFASSIDFGKGYPCWAVTIGDISFYIFEEEY